MFRLHNYFATNALHGSVYDMEDLMNCVMVNENLTTFIRNWDTILSGIPTPPDNSVLEPLFHRQIKKCKVIDHDIQVYERALEGSEQRCYEFLYKAVVNHLKRQRLQKNRDRIARQTGVPTAPAPPAKKIPKGFCVDWVKNGSCSRDKCTYKHQTPRGRSQTPGRTPTTPRRTPSPGGKGKGKRQECKFFKQGVCNRGDKCNFLHKGQPAAPAPGDSSARASSSGKKDKKHKKKERKGGKGRKSSRSSSRSSSKSSSRKSSRSSQGSKGSRGSGRKGGAPSVPAAVCLIGAMLAGSASRPMHSHSGRKCRACPTFAPRTIMSHWPQYHSMMMPSVSHIRFPKIMISFPLKTARGPGPMIRSTPLAAIGRLRLTPSRRRKLVLRCCRQ